MKKTGTFTELPEGLVESRNKKRLNWEIVFLITILFVFYIGIGVWTSSRVTSSWEGGLITSLLVFALSAHMFRDKSSSRNPYYQGDSWIGIVTALSATLIYWCGVVSVLAYTTGEWYMYLLCLALFASGAFIMARKIL